MTSTDAPTPLNPYLPTIARGHWLCDSEDTFAPRIHTAPVDHFRRLHQIFDQHLSDWAPNCHCGDLIVAGVNQHELLGRLFHSYLFETNKLFNKLPIPPANVYVRCSDV
jgi:hypothetical protein